MGVEEDTAVDLEVDEGGAGEEGGVSRAVSSAVMSGTSKLGFCLAEDEMLQP